MLLGVCSGELQTLPCGLSGTTAHSTVSSLHPPRLLNVTTGGQSTVIAFSQADGWGAGDRTRLAASRSAVAEVGIETSAESSAEQKSKSASLFGGTAPPLSPRTFSPLNRPPSSSRAPGR